MAKAAKKTKEPKEKKPKGPTVGSVAMDAIKAGKTNEDALAIVKKQFPKASTSLSSVAWYRNKLRQDGAKVPTSRELKKKDAPAKPKKAAAKKKGGKGGDPTA